MMTFNERHRCVLPLSPTACAYAKLNEYFGKLREAKIEVLQARGDFGDNLPLRQVLRSGNNEWGVKRGGFATLISEMKEMAQDTLLPVCKYYFGLFCGAN